MKFVRIKPFNPKRGQTMRSYTRVEGRDIYREERGWYEVQDDKEADELAKVRVDADDPRSPLAFDVAATREEAEQIEANDPPPEPTQGDAVRHRIHRPGAGGKAPDTEVMQRGHTAEDPQAAQKDSEGIKKTSQLPGTPSKKSSPAGK